MKLTDRGSTPSTKAEYRYNGLGQRVAYRLGGTGTWYDLVQDEQWREVAVVDRTNSKLLERTLYHNAGLNGRGGSSYIDSAAIRETNPTTGTYPVMQTRWYTLQNWRADVVATLASDGTLSAWSSYTAYGKQQIWYVADVDDGSGNGVPDGGVTIDDELLYLAWFDAGDPRADVDDGTGTGALDGGVTIDDLLFYLDQFGTGGGMFDSRLGYAGYVKDEADSGLSGLYHVRYRVYSTDLGSWLTQDPLGYIDGESLYEYCSSCALKGIDPLGLGVENAPGPGSNPREFIRWLKSLGFEIVEGGPHTKIKYKGRVQTAIPLEDSPHEYSEYRDACNWIAAKVFRTEISNLSYWPIWAWYKWKNELGNVMPPLNIPGHIHENESGYCVELIVSSRDVLLSQLELWEHVILGQPIARDRAELDIFESMFHKGELTQSAIRSTWTRMFDLTFGHSDLWGDSATRSVQACLPFIDPDQVSRAYPYAGVTTVSAKSLIAPVGAKTPIASVGAKNLIAPPTPPSGSDDEGHPPSERR